jgi:hypothetical protein
MFITTHTTPAGVLRRVNFDEFDSMAHGYSGSGWFDFDEDGIMWNSNTEFEYNPYNPDSCTLFVAAQEFLASEYSF